MAAGEGADWEIKPKDVERSTTAAFRVMVSSPGQSPETQEDTVSMELTQEDTPVTAAMKLAQAWNTQKHLEEVAAVAGAGERLTAFFLTGDLASWTIAEMIIWFPGQDGRPMSFGQPVEWDKGPLRVTRVQVDVSPPQSG